MRASNQGRAFAGAIGLLVAGFCVPAMADSFHYRNLMVGDRAIGFGGAYAALSDDTAGLFYNPAGSPYSSETASATVNVLSRSSVEYENFFPDGGSLKSTSSGLVPSYFAIQRIEDPYVFGFSIAVTDYLSERQLDKGSFSTGGANVDEFLTGDVDRRVYNVGPSIAMKFGGGWSGGVTLYGSYRDLRESHSIGGEADRPGTETGSTDRLNVLTSYRIEDTQIGVRPVLGLQYRSKIASYGLVASRDFGINRNYDYLYRSSRNLITQNAGGSVTPVQVLDIAADSSSSIKQDFPWQLSLGVAVELQPGWRVSAQADHSFAVNQKVSQGADSDSPPVTRQFEAVTNFSLGTELEASKVVRLRASVFTDYSNSEVAGAGSFERRENIDLIGASLGGTFRDTAREYKLGFYYSRGKGKGTLGDLGELNFSGQDAVDAKSRNLTLLFGVTL